jgi:hypothetical protein
MTDRTLADRIWAKLRAGDLPMRRPRKVWGGPSEGGECAACDVAIGKGVLEIEVHGADGRVRLYHLDCYALLDAIRDRGRR